jgi:hypothetical protein
MDTANIDDQGLHVGPTLESLEEGLFVEKVDQPAEDPKPDEQPAPKKLAGKYDTAEDLEKAYIELQKLVGRKSKDDPAADEKPDEKAIEGEPKEGEDEPASGDEQPPLVDIAKLSHEWEANEGKLTDETQANLTKLGITPEVTELFYAGVQSIIASRANEVQSLAGSADEYNTLIAWGAKNLEDGEQQAFNTALDKALYEGDTAAIKLMIPAVRAKMAGEGPSYVQSRSNDGSGPIKPFANLTEQSAAINDRRYGRDAAYTREVEQRIGLSSF